MSRFRLGIDIGGTFTDLCLFEEDGGQFFNLKVPTTPKDLTLGVMDACERIFENSRSPSDVTLLFHATTVATNALLEQKGANTWLVISEGYTAVYETPELGEIRVGSYDYLSYPKPRLLVPQRKTLQAPERIGSRGEIVRPLDDRQMRRRLRRLKSAEVESVAVCLLFSFLNPQHELRVRELIHEVAPNAQVYLSSETLPQIREYPRLATTVANAYVAPIVSRYVDRLEQALATRGLTRRLYIMQSTGGSITSGALSKVPIHMIESGPTAGVLAAAHFGRVTGNQRLISFDMGGTTAKAGLIDGGEPRIVQRFQAGEWLLSIPSVDLVEIGSGGGSLAWIDKSGLLKVGPQSAGADPGPACYPHGGQAPTVTDADLVLGWLNPEYFLGGKIRLDRSAAERAIKTHVGDPLELDLISAADGIVKIVQSQMVEALRLVTVSRGEDPRHSTLVAFGGGGPVHAAKLAEELKIPRVLIPRFPGVTSAMGLLVSDLKRDYLKSRFAELDKITSSEIQFHFETMENTALAELREDHFPEDQIRFERALDLRYSIQKYELTVPVNSGTLRDTDKKNWRERFDESHEQHYGSRAEDQKVEIVNYRLTAKIPLPKLAAAETTQQGEGPEAALKGSRRAYFERWVDCPLYDRDRLSCENRIVGPAIIEQIDSTVVIHPGQSAHVDRYGNIIIEV